ncbi:MAG: response regulator [Erythrobacter sp.]
MNTPQKSDRILIVHRVKKTAKMIKDLLEQGGFHDIVTERSGKAGFELCCKLADDAPTELATEPFDLLLLDLDIDDMDGLELCAKLRINNATRNMPILVVTSATEVEDLNQAYMAGADDFVISPINAVRLYARVRTLLRIQREQKRKTMREADLRLQNLNLKQGKLEAALIEPVTGIPRDGLVELILNSCREERQPAALGLMQIGDFDLYGELHGETAANSLKRQVGELISTSSGPMSAVLCVYGPGTFMVVQPGSKSKDALEAMMDAVSQKVADEQIEHGNSLSEPKVVLHTSCTWGKGAELVSLTGQLLEGARTQLLEWRHDT